MSNIVEKKKLTVGEQHQKAFDAMVKKSKTPVPQDFYEKFTEYFKTLTSYESVPIHIGKERDVSYDALMYAIKNEYKYYVTFRTEEKNVYCPHPSYIVGESKKEVSDDERSYFIGKPLEVINKYICEKSTFVLRTTYLENNHTCYLYGFQELYKEFTNSYGILKKIEEEYSGDVLFISADDKVVTHYTRFEVDKKKGKEFYDKLAQLFYRSEKLGANNTERIQSK